MHRARRAFCDMLTMAVSYSPWLSFSRISRVSSGPPSSWVHICWLLFVEMRNVQYSTLLCTRTSIFCRRQHVEFVLNSTGRQNSVQTKSIDFTITTLVDRRDCCILDSSYYIERKYVKKCGRNGLWGQCSALFGAILCCGGVFGVVVLRASRAFLGYDLLISCRVLWTFNKYQILWRIYVIFIRWNISYNKFNSSWTFPKPRSGPAKKATSPMARCFFAIDSRQPWCLLPTAASGRCRAFFIITSRRHVTPASSIRDGARDRPRGRGAYTNRAYERDYRHSQQRGLFQPQAPQQQGETTPIDSNCASCGVANRFCMDHPGFYCSGPCGRWIHAKCAKYDCRCPGPDGGEEGGILRARFGYPSPLVVPISDISKGENPLYCITQVLGERKKRTGWWCSSISFCSSPSRQKDATSTVTRNIYSRIEHVSKYVNEDMLEMIQQNSPRPCPTIRPMSSTTREKVAKYGRVLEISMLCFDVRQCDCCGCSGCTTSWCMMRRCKNLPIIKIIHFAASYHLVRQYLDTSIGDGHAWNKAVVGLPCKRNKTPPGL